MESSTPVTLNNPNTSDTKTIKKTVDTDLKSSIIEFMRERPFLWNSKHPNYKDHKRREHEFQVFSSQINYPVQEIKRVWHVLRTNFFRAHKLLLDRPQNSENGEKLWKYYLAMDYILEGSTVEDSRDIRQTRSSKTFKDPKGARLQKESNNSVKNCSIGSSGSSSSSNSSRIVNNTSGINNNSLSNNSKDTCSYLSMEADDDHLYARSLTSTLKKFDPTTKEIIKLKFQEIIVEYMTQTSQLESVDVPAVSPSK